MLTLRRANERGHADHGWLDSYHTFSFADYHDPKHMGFRTLRVINEDRVAPGKGFGTHGHRDMEILSYVLSGSLQHRDSMGNGSVIRPGDVQRMSAGTGVQHSEFNGSQTEKVHFLQIWILPRARNLPAGYEQKHFSNEERRGKLRLIASEKGEEGSVSLQSDLRLYASLLGNGEKQLWTPPPGRSTWLHLARGSLKVDGQLLGPGDAVSTSDGTPIPLEGVDLAEFLIFDLP
ncbi:MAG TPA: pirin family protein [Myxococcota bacterium]|nr:pirin family protein [Myxococcota bacterium]HND30196.1 pirin family protein [Myxococcota bacterium]